MGKKTLTITIKGKLLERLKEKAERKGFPELYFARTILAKKLGVDFNDMSVRRGVN
jgi:hypothetical protein